MQIIVKEPRKKISWSNVALVLLMSMAIGQWAFIAGTFQPAVVSYNSMEEVHKSYNHLRIFEDGSYEGQTSGGLQVTGCISGGLCDNELANK